jgi:hypothetical protein
LGAAPRPSSTPGRIEFAGSAHSRIAPLRFLLSGDFRLGEVCRPVAGLDSEIEKKLISAPYAAAANVFDLAVLEQVDFVMLVGQLFSPTDYGVQEPAFLTRQFSRLAEHGISVLWARECPLFDAAAPDWIAWPNNMIEIDSSARQEYEFHRADGRSAQIVCGGRAPSIIASTQSLRIGVIPSRGDFENDPGEQTEVDLLVAGNGAWTAADGVDHSIPPQFSRGAGPQGRGFDEYGPHGCWLVTMDSRQCIEVDFIPCDVIRWRCEVAEMDDDMTWDELLMTCLLQTRRSLSSGHAVTLVQWQMIGHGPLSRELSIASRQQAFLDALRNALGLESALEGRIAIAGVEVILDPKEEARLRSEQTSWAAWSSAIDDFSDAASLPELQPLDAGTVHARHGDRSVPAVPNPHFKKLRRTALHKLVQRFGND